MYTSEADICNSALHKVGGARIIALTDNSREAQLCRDIFSKVFSRLLRAHPWKFAMKRVALAALPTAPLFEYAKAFQLPTDCLRVIKVQGDECFNWTTEGRALLTDNDTAVIQYIQRVTDITLLPDDFGDALAGAIAVELSYALTSSDSTKQTVAAFADRALREARTFSAQEGAGDRLYADEWLNSRR